MPALYGPPQKALVRAVPDSFAKALHSDQGARLDPERARAQTAAYARALEAIGIEVQSLPADEACPDCCFIEDTAVIVAADQAYLTRPGAPSRLAEVGPVGKALADLELWTDWDHACKTRLDGGDVLRLGDCLMIGLSDRSTANGADDLARFAAKQGLSARRMPVSGALHLKSLATLAAPDLAVVLAGSGLEDSFAPHGMRVLITDEPQGANVLALGKTVLVSAAAPETARRLAAEPGLAVLSLDLSELHKADGALTCLSLRIPAPGQWCC